ncbi:MAG TPA: Lrp/AsnC family transcriptional regulator [Actinomycetota bacterium]|jgi:Lrp/AsnC family transcriptional regulator for asnA, asnC and gidA|nr:Lrp/AsnC family transcriptional regulator [Actinomycetota bacterium]
MPPLIDELDLRILDLLQTDGRMPFVKIAEQLGVSDTTVRTRVDRLVRRFGVKFVVDVDPNDLGLVYVYLAVGVRGPALARAVERMTALPSVIFLARTVGTHDLMAEAICRDHEDLMRLLDEIRAIPGVVRMDTLTVLRVEKEDWRFVGLAAGQG